MEGGVGKQLCSSESGSHHVAWCSKEEDMPALADSKAIKDSALQDAGLLPHRPRPLRPGIY